MSDEEDQAAPAATPMARKLGVREGVRILLLEPPLGFSRKLEPLPSGVSLFTRSQGPGAADLIALFASTKTVLAELFQKASQAMAPRGRIWAVWPRKASGMFTDLSEDQVRAIGLSHGMSDDKILSLDDIWAALRFQFKERPRLNRPSSKPELQTPGA